MHLSKSPSRLSLMPALCIPAGCSQAQIPVASEGASDNPEATAQASEPTTLTLWGYPSPFAFYSRGPGYVRMSLIFDTLTWKDEEGVIPWPADEWDVSDDGLTWTFTLHPGVYWHDGTPLTVEDVAFTFEYFKEHRIYDANPGYFKGAPIVDSVVFIKVENEALALETGTTDYASFSGKSIEAAKQFEGQADYQILDGAIVAGPGILSPDTGWHNPNLPTYDPDKALEMLADLGIADLTLNLITTANYAREAELIQANLAEVGIQVTVQSGDTGTVDGRLREGNFDLAINGHGGLANPAILESPTWPATIYPNATYDEIYQEQSRTADADAR